jgi:phage gp36-like protein
MADQWASTSQMATRYDERTLRGLISDDDDLAATVTEGGVLDALLEDATGVIQSAVYQGRTYTSDQMATLTASPLLIRLVCDIAIKMLFARRARDMPSAVQQNYDEAMDILDEIRKGVRVFDSVQNAASQTVSGYVQPTTTRPNNLPISSSPLYPSWRVPL